MDRRYSPTVCECGDAFCTGCNEPEVDRTEFNEFMAWADEAYRVSNDPRACPQSRGIHPRSERVS